MKFLTTSGLANAAGVPEQTVRNLEGRGIIKCTRDSSNRRLFKQDAVAAVKEYRQRRVTSTSNRS